MRPSKLCVSFYEAIGVAAQLGCGDLSIQEALLWLSPPIELDQIVFSQDNAGRTIGFATWAYFDEDVSASFLGAINTPLILQDWNGGCTAFLIHFVCAPGTSSRLFRKIRRTLAPRHEYVRVAVRSLGDSSKAERVRLMKLS